MVHILKDEAPNGGQSLTSLIMRISNSGLTNRPTGPNFGTQGKLCNQNLLKSCDLGSKVIDPKYHINAYYEVP